MTEQIKPSRLERKNRALVDALADEFERSIKSGQSPKIEDFLDRIAEVARPAALRELLNVEIELRHNRLKYVNPEDYLGRFSNFEQVVLDACQQSDVRLATAEREPASRMNRSAETVPRKHSDTGSGRLEVRCPSCHAPMEVAVDTSLTDLTCRSCGSHFSLVDQSKATRMAPSLTRMGRFELIERLGVGGFGSVWKARDKELDRTVAIKIPRAGAMSGEEQEKFFREARAAAQLRHPAIVSVHEVGRDGDSVYIVSDFVRGVTLGDWLTGQQLTNREAADLCAKIADALHHAHEQGVVHRDLKPANIMMDYEGQPHLMDFGLARRETGEVTMTIDGQILGTPAYMPPEQAQGEAHTADRRSDVYSLGVILFQVLTGELPFRGNARMLIKQVITDEPPSPRKLNANVSRDLETITLKCLEKNPSRRYETAQELGRELHRFLDNEPIMARPISRLGRSTRWARRHPQVASLSGLVAAVLVAGTLVSTWQAIRATHAENLAGKRLQAEIQSRKEAQAVTEFLVSTFESTDPARDGRMVTVSEVLARAEKGLESDLPDQPLTQSSLLLAIGRSFVALGLSKTAIKPLTAAKDLRVKHLGPDHEDTLVAMIALANAYRNAYQPDYAARHFEEAVALARKKLGGDHQVTLTAIDGLAITYSRSGKTEKAIALQKEALRVRQQKLGSEHEETLTSLAHLGLAHLEANRPNEALPLLEQVVAAERRRGGIEHPKTLLAMMWLANTYLDLSRYDDAIKLHEQCLVAKRETLGDSHPETSKSKHNLLLTIRARAYAYQRAGRLDDAKRSVDDYVIGFLQRGEYSLAFQLARSADPEQLEKLIRTAADYDHNRALSASDALVLGELQLVGGKPDLAVHTILSAVVRGATADAAYKSLGWALRVQGRTNEAAEAFRNALKARRRNHATYDLSGAGLDEMTCAYFLDLVSEQNYADQVKENKQLACFPWFYIGQRREIDGEYDAAITAYQRCVQLGTQRNATGVVSFARWRLSKLSASVEEAGQK